MADPNRDALSLARRGSGERGEGFNAERAVAAESSQSFWKTVRVLCALGV